MPERLETGNYVLLFYSSGDLLGTWVKRTLEARGVDLIAVDFTAPPSLSLEFGQGGSWSLTVNDRRLSPPAAAWFRWKLAEPARVSCAQHVEEKLRITEWRAFLSGLGALIGRRALNGAWWAHSKVFQQHQALVAGFNVPQSSFFLGKSNGIASTAEYGSTVMKAIGNPNIARFDDLGEAQFLVTTPISAETLLNAPAEEFTAHPMWFQQRIQTGHELRILVLGRDVFASRIVGTIETRALVDSRLTRREFEAASLPTELHVRIHRYMQLMGLDYGVLDILCSNGEFWFLECNPDGQWESAKPFGIEEVMHSASEMIIDRAREGSELDLLVKNLAPLPGSRT